MEINKHYVLKTVSELYGSKRITYCNGRGWTDNMMQAKFYTSSAAAIKVMDAHQKTHPQSKFEILYITITTETLDEVTEREMLDS